MGFDFFFFFPETGLFSGNNVLLGILLALWYVQSSQILFLMLKN